MPLMHETKSPETTVRQAGPERIPILLVEDNFLIRLGLAEDLRAASYRVIEAGDADEALAILRSGANADILITDVRMPGTIDGIDLARIVRDEHPAMKIVFATGQTSELDGVVPDGVFGKPCDVRKLIAHLKRLTDGATRVS